MTGLISLTLSGIRHLADTTFTPVPSGFNFIFGNNGAGKSSLLESIYYLSMGRSFRSHLSDRVISHSADHLSLFGKIQSAHGVASLGLERRMDGKIKCRMNGEDVASVSELTKSMPVQLIDSYCHRLLDGSPAIRRQYLNFGLFYGESDFLHIWRQCERALKQRNAALRGQLPRQEVDVWTEKLVDSALQLDEARRRYVEELRLRLDSIVKELLPVFNLTIAYHSGWNSDYDYPAILAKNIDKDYQWGYTQSGPHKADLSILINGIPAKDILSRGQQKLVCCAMILARGSVMLEGQGEAPIYLVDDLPSELDMFSRAALLSLLSRQQAQVFVTSIIESGMVYDTLTSPFKMFHVEQLSQERSRISEKTRATTMFPIELFHVEHSDTKEILTE